MKTKALIAIGALMLAGGALAAPTPAPPRLFLSPSGEPFHATPAAPDPVKTWFDQVEVKRQGYIDREEFRADAVRFFKRLDANGDGVIDGFEVADYEHKLVPELLAEAQGPFAGSTQGGGRGGEPGGGRERGGRRRQGEPREAGGDNAGGDNGEQSGGRGKGPSQRAILQLIGEPEPVSGADFNLDSHITLDEWMRATDQRFEILDEAKDGKLTLAELKARFVAKPKGQ